MRIHPTGRRWRPLAAALLMAGGALTASELLGLGGGPHPQPLPAHVFSIGPAAARALPGPPPLARPQPGSIQADCTRPPASQPQVDMPSLCIYAPLVPAPVRDSTLVIPADVHLAGLDAQSAALGARHGTTIIAGQVDNASQGDGPSTSFTRSSLAPSSPSPAPATRPPPGASTGPPSPPRPPSLPASGPSPAPAAWSWSPAAAPSSTPPPATPTSTTSSSTPPPADVRDPVPCRNSFIGDDLAFRAS
jgi:hypothetical protein